jgi:short-subunit dehydrogenase
MMAWAVITGGSSGIGHGFAEELARRGYNLVLASRDQSALDTTARDLHAGLGISVEVIPTDLSSREQTMALAERVADPDRPIELLINNAGFAVRDSLLVEDTSLHERGLDVMCRAVLILSGAAARAMKARGHGAIMNVASSAAVIREGNYSAIKAWVQVYTESLAVELAGSGVRAMALMPGWVKTEFHSRAGVTAHKLPGIVWVPMKTLVNQGLKDLRAGKVLSVPTKRWAFAVWLARVVPTRAIRWVSSALMNSRKK